MDFLETYYFENSLDGGFLQSPYWEYFQQNIGRKTHRVGNAKLFNAFCVFHALPIIGTYMFIPRGPIINQTLHDKNQDEREVIGHCLKEIIDVAKEKKCGWIRIEPQHEQDLKLLKDLFSSHKIKRSKKSHEPPQTILLGLSRPKEELLMSMKPKTRYNIRLAEKKEVRVERIKTGENINAFCRLSKITAQRDKITLHPESYYRKMLSSVPDEHLCLYSARFKNKIIAANLVSFYGGVAAYLHGASGNDYRNVMAPFALQWQAIMDAKERRYKHYDLGGTKIGEDGAYQKNWAGISRFKQGFCPKCKPVDFPGCWDIILNQPRYYMYRFLQGARGLLS
ncbi:MAG: peptidoglycan bridge formation glycyltransferase FemA/FemB family protein [Patescibacteria group bacterium]|nr:peptidoglycan bridge formation glycyltransferase FemA/FemB family protein [Patescibacteria group bacterium]